ncbi:hypothetical protein [Rivularia sp. UHCC 0363]|uniref:hypothetical protein n=1 Tax=Rivularia sp. UHCC 0363 TaxID=3110244 RepID=UPI002B21EE2A|nr:hypothetical protein [Rivularia sp. UHCC 0363]MEA5593188.1 hypothetical protein [Rivularia sp. UHCC 0363]
MALLRIYHSDRHFLEVELLPFRVYDRRLKKTDANALSAEEIKKELVVREKLGNDL